MVILIKKINFSLFLFTESENQYKNIYQVLKKNILMNLDEISSDTSVFKSKCDYLSLPPILHKKCKDRHLGKNF